MLQSTPQHYHSHLQILDAGDAIDSNVLLKWDISDHSITEVAHKERVHNKDRLFVIPQLLSQNECKDLLNKCTTQSKFESIANEYPESYRNSERIIFKDYSISKMLWDSLEKVLDFSELSKNVHPFGLDNTGKWKAYGVNECLRFSKYEKGAFFKPHIDGQFVKDDHHRSVYTLLIYLNEDFEGGETRFLHETILDNSEKFFGNLAIKSTHEQEANKRLKLETSDIEVSDMGSKMKTQRYFNVLHCLTPTIGTVALFNHDMYHDGCTVTKNVKYILRTEIMFKRIDAKSVPRDDNFEKSALYQKIGNLFNCSDKLEKKGLIAKATDKFIEAQDLLRNSGHTMDRMVANRVSNYKKVHAIDTIDNELTEIPEEVLLHVFSFLSDRELCTKIIPLNQYFNSLGRSPILWKNIYGHTWSESKTFGYLVQQDEPQDWYFSTISRRYLEQDFSSVCVDLRQIQTMYGILNGKETIVQSFTTVTGSAHGVFYRLSKPVMATSEVIGTPYKFFNENGMMSDEQVFVGFITLIYESLDVCAPRHPLLLSIPPQWSETCQKLANYANLFFQQMSIAAICFVPRHMLVAISHQLPTCLVIDLDYCGISISCVVDSHLPYSNTKFCLLNTDKDASLAKMLTFGKTSFITGSIISFLSGKDNTTRKSLLNNIVLCGDFTMSSEFYQVFTEVLHTEINNLSENNKCTISFHLGTTFDAFYGAQIYASAPDFKSKCIYWPGQDDKKPRQKIDRRNLHPRHPRGRSMPTLRSRGSHTR